MNLKGFTNQLLSNAVNIPSVAFERNVIEAVHRYVQLLKKLGAPGPWYVAMGITNIQKSILHVAPQYSFSGRVFEGENILPRAIEISSDIDLENPEPTARALRTAFDHIWREHNYPQSLNYAKNGDWVGQ